MNDNKSIWLDLINRENLKFNINPLLESDYNIGSKGESKFVFYYSAKYAKSNFTRHQFAWFRSAEIFEEFLSCYLPCYIICDLDRITNSDKPEDHWVAFKSYFHDPEIFDAWFWMYKVLVSSLLEADHTTRMKPLLNMFLIHNTNIHKVRFCIEFIGSKSDLLTSNEESESIKYLREEIMYGFIKSDEEFLDYFCMDLYFGDFIQRSFEDLIGFVPFNYESYMKLHNETEANPVADEMIREIFRDYAESVSSLYLKSYIIENYVNFKRYK